MKVVHVALLLVLSVAAPGARQNAPAPTDEDATLQRFVQAVEDALGANDAARWVTLLSTTIDRDAAREYFDAAIAESVTRAVVRERDRLPLSGVLPGEGFQLIVDVFTERGTRGRIYTWRLDVRRPRQATDPQPWRVVGYETLSTIDGLHHLRLDTARQFAVKNLVLRAVDLELRLPHGELFVADTADGVTAIVALGDGTMAFTPLPPEERGQVRLFTGADTLVTPFSAAFVRLNPIEFTQQIQPQLTEAAVDSRVGRRAQVIFDEEAGKSFSLDLRDLSRENWSLLPQPGDFVAEVRTRKFGTLTYARAYTQPEDVTLFHRARQRNIAAYASETKLRSRGRFFDEDQLVEYDVLDYTIDTDFSPVRGWLDGHARLTLRVKAFALSAFTLRLAEEFNVTSITSDKLGRLMFLRVRNQNDVVVNLPASIPRDFEMTLNIAYAGPIQTQAIDQEGIAVGIQEGMGRGAQSRGEDLPFVPAERNWLFSNRSHWYPQNQVTDYATATIRFGVPPEYKVIATGVEALDSPVTTAVAAPGSLGRITYVYEAVQPVRYIGVIISKFLRVDRASVALQVDTPRTSVALAIDANRRQEARGRDLLPTAAEIMQFYASMVGAAPYDALTVAMVEFDRPGGHSPAYVAVLNNPLPVTQWGPRHDPAAFNNFPEFYIAHEIAHQWWGQAVGWKNYHEQWLSEGLAQYFAVLYAKERRGDDVFRDALRHLRRWAMDQSDQGAVYLGYRLGHIKGDSRVFRAVVYNKGAAVLHMLRRLLGDEVFFRGLQRYYRENTYKKAGTEDLQRAMEAESGTSLERFFERWIYASGLPRVRYSTEATGGELIVRFEQLGEVYDLPVTISVQHGDKAVEEVVLLSDAVTEKRMPLAGALRSVEINDDHAALAHFEKTTRQSSR